MKNEEEEQELLDSVYQLLEDNDEESRNKLLEIVKERIEDLMNALSRSGNREHNGFDQTLNKEVVSLILKRMKHPMFEKWEDIRTAKFIDINTKGQSEIIFLDKFVKELNLFITSPPFGKPSVQHVNQPV